MRIAYLDLGFKRIVTNALIAALFNLSPNYVYLVRPHTELLDRIAGDANLNG
jgi:hypothetical protein